MVDKKKKIFYLWTKLVQHSSDYNYKITSLQFLIWIKSPQIKVQCSVVN